MVSERPSASATTEADNIRGCVNPNMASQQALLTCCCQFLGSQGKVCKTARPQASPLPLPSLDAPRYDINLVWSGCESGQRKILTKGRSAYFL